jgi:hypothetical protein
MLNYHPTNVVLIATAPTLISLRCVCCFKWHNILTFISHQVNRRQDDYASLTKGFPLGFCYSRVCFSYEASIIWSLVLEQQD